MDARLHPGMNQEVVFRLDDKYSATQSPLGGYKYVKWWYVGPVSRSNPRKSNGSLKTSTGSYMCRSWIFHFLVFLGQWSYRFLFFRWYGPPKITGPFFNGLVLPRTPPPPIRDTPGPSSFLRPSFTISWSPI